MYLNATWTNLLHFTLLPTVSSISLMILKSFVGWIANLFSFDKGRYDLFTCNDNGLHIKYNGPEDTTASTAVWVLPSVTMRWKGEIGVPSEFLLKAEKDRFIFFPFDAITRLILYLIELYSCSSIGKCPSSNLDLFLLTFKTTPLIIVSLGFPLPSVRGKLNCFTCLTCKSSGLAHGCSVRKLSSRVSPRNWREQQGRTGIDGLRRTSNWYYSVLARHTLWKKSSLRWVSRFLCAVNLPAPAPLYSSWQKD